MASLSLTFIGECQLFKLGGVSSTKVLWVRLFCDGTVRRDTLSSMFHVELAADMYTLLWLVHISALSGP